MAGALFHIADQLGCFRIAGIRMHMLLAEQIPPLQGITTVRMGMYGFLGRFRLRITAVGMLVRLGLRKRTPKNAVFVIAGRVVMVNHIVRLAADQLSIRVITGIRMLVNPKSLRRADRHLLFNCRHLRIAGVGMGMLRKTAVLLHRDGRQDQRIGGTEHHHCRQTGRHSVPALPAPPLLRIFLHCFLFVLSHITHQTP